MERRRFFELGGDRSGNWRGAARLHVDMQEHLIAGRRQKTLRGVVEFQPGADSLFIVGQ